MSHSVNFTQGSDEFSKQSFIIRPSTLAELAAQYGVCTRTFSKWIKPFSDSIGEKNGRFYTAAQVQVIFEKIGPPSCIWEK